LKYPDVHALVAANYTDAGQLDCFVRYIEADPALRAAGAIGAWEEVARRYNGSGQVAVYAAKLEAAAAHCTANPDEAPRAMREGDTGQDVAELQRALGIPADGSFGSATKAAVKLFQATHRLMVDGIAGAMTMAELKKAGR